MRVRRFGLLAVVAASALVAGACTGDGDIEVLVEDGTDPSVLLGGAIDRTVTQSGRLTQTMVWDFGGTEWSPDTGDVTVDDVEDRTEFTVEGEFDGRDLRMEVTVPGDEPEQGTWLVVDGVEYWSAVDDDVDMGGRTWIEVPDWGQMLRDPDESAGTGDAGDPFAGLQTPGDLAASLEALRDLVDLSEVESGEIEGVEHRRFVGRTNLLGGSGLLDSEYAPELDPDERVRWERIEAYRAERQGTETEVWIDDDGLVRRLVVTEVNEFEPQYRECFHLLSIGMSAQIDLFDLGAEVDISAPDPADVMPAEEYEELTGFDRAAWKAMDEWDGEGEPPLPEELLGDELTTTTVVGGEEWFGAESGPMYDTPLGPMGEQRLRSLVRLGMEQEKVDPSLADGMTPEQLVELMEGYLSNPDNAGLAGPGTFDDDVVAFDPADVDYDMFAGCPA